jgi:hypothetical protein
VPQLVSLASTTALDAPNSREFLADLNVFFIHMPENGTRP